MEGTEKERPRSQGKLMRIRSTEVTGAWGQEGQHRGVLGTVKSGLIAGAAGGLWGVSARQVFK